MSCLLGCISSRQLIQKGSVSHLTSLYPFTRFCSLSCTLLFLVSFSLHFFRVSQSTSMCHLLWLLSYVWMNLLLVFIGYDAHILDVGDVFRKWKLREAVKGTKLHTHLSSLCPHCHLFAIRYALCTLVTAWEDAINRTSLTRNYCFSNVFPFFRPSHFPRQSGRSPLFRLIIQFFYPIF